MLVVTGANGFIGSALIWELNQRGYTDILAADSIPLENRNLLAPLKISDFCDKDKLPALIEKNSAKIQGLFHIGACSSTTETNEAFLRENNTEYSKVMFLLSKKVKCPFLYASSAAIYGNGEFGFDDQQSPEYENEKYKPLNPYGYSKLWFDQWILSQQTKDQPWFGFRYFNVYGPNEYHKNDMASVVFKAFQQINETGQLKLFKSHNPQYRNGEQLRDFVYVKDITRWMVEIFESKSVASGIYNMGYGQCRTWLELANSVFKTLNVEPKIQWIDIPENIRNQYQYRTEAKIDKLIQHGISSPRWSLESGIHDYLINYLMTSHPEIR